MPHSSSQSGYVALMAALVITTILSVWVVDSSLTSWLLSASVLDRQAKVQSEVAAEACITLASFKLEQNRANGGGGQYYGSETITDTDIVPIPCTIDSFEPDSQSLTIRAFATSGKSVSVMTGHIDSSAHQLTFTNHPPP